MSSGSRPTVVVKSTIVVQGPGAVGLWVAARLGRSGHDVVVLDHRPDRGAALARAGIRFRALEAEGSETVPEPETETVPVRSAWTAKGLDVGERVVLVVCVKSYAVESAVREARGLLPDATEVLVLSNGLGHGEAALRYWPREQVHLGSSTYGSESTEPGCVRETGAGVIRLDGPEELVTVLRDAGVSVVVEACVERIVWEKAVINCGLNPVAALLRCTNGELENSAALSVSAGLACEAACVANVEHPELALSEEVEFWRSRVADVCRLTAANRCSMLRDVEEGRPTEIESLNGEIARRSHGAKLNDAFARLIRAMDRSKQLAGTAPAPDVRPEWMRVTR